MCFSGAWLVELLVWLIIIGAVVAIIRVVLPLVAGWLGAPGGAVVQILTIVLWAVVLIFVVYFAYDMISCLLGGVHLPRIGR